MNTLRYSYLNPWFQGDMQTVRFHFRFKVFIFIDSIPKNKVPENKSLENFTYSYSYMYLPRLRAFVIDNDSFFDFDNCLFKT